MKKVSEPNLTLSLFAKREVGEILRRARVAKGLSTADVASELRFSKDRIVALEASDWQNLPEPVYVRGYIRSYANLLNVSADDLCEQYDQGAPTQTTRKVGWLSSPNGRPMNLSSLWFKVTVFSLIILGGTMLLIWWYGNKQQNISYGETGGQSHSIEPLQRRYPIIE